MMGKPTGTLTLRKNKQTHHCSIHSRICRVDTSQDQHALDCPSSKTPLWYGQAAWFGAWVYCPSPFRSLQCSQRDRDPARTMGSLRSHRSMARPWKALFQCGAFRRKRTEQHTPALWYRPCTKGSYRITLSWAQSVWNQSSKQGSNLLAAPLHLLSLP